MNPRATRSADGGANTGAAPTPPVRTRRRRHSDMPHGPGGGGGARGPPAARGGGAPPPSSAPPAGSSKLPPLPACWGAWSGASRHATRGSMRLSGLEPASGVTWAGRLALPLPCPQVQCEPTDLPAFAAALQQEVSAALTAALACSGQSACVAQVSHRGRGWPCTQRRRAAAKQLSSSPTASCCGRPLRLPLGLAPHAADAALAGLRVQGLRAPAHGADDGWGGGRHAGHGRRSCPAAARGRRRSRSRQRRPAVPAGAGGHQAAGQRRLHSAGGRASVAWHRKPGSPSGRQRGRWCAHVLCWALASLRPCAALQTQQLLHVAALISMHTVLQCLPATAATLQPS